MLNEERLERRFGAVAVEKGFATAEQVVEAMKIQILEEIEKGEHRLIGRILVEKGFMSSSQIIEVLKFMGIPTDRLR